MRGQILEDDPDNTSVGETLWTTLVRLLPNELAKGMSGVLAQGKYVTTTMGLNRRWARERANRTPHITTVGNTTEKKPKEQGCHQTPRARHGR